MMGTKRSDTDGTTRQLTWPGAAALSGSSSLLAKQQDCHWVSHTVRRLLLKGQACC